MNIVQRSFRPVLVLTAVLFTSNAYTAVPTGVMGYAAGTTGGAGGRTVTVTSLSALEAAAKSTEKLIIKISGTIRGSKYINVNSNKSLIGVNKGTLIGINLRAYGKQNIIFQNLTIKDIPYAVGGDAITIKQGTSKVWIDHCTFSGNTDGMVDITEQSDLVTISWSKFSSNDKAILIGGADTSTGDRGKLRVTLHHNYFYDTFDRNPSVRFGQVHSFNNYFVNDNQKSDYGIGVRIESTVRTDNNYFENWSKHPITTFGTRPGKVSGANTNVYKNCGSNNITTGTSTWKPPYSYSAYLESATAARSSVMAGAGAR